MRRRWMTFVFLGAFLMHGLRNRATRGISAEPVQDDAIVGVPFKLHQGLPSLSAAPLAPRRTLTS